MERPASVQSRLPAGNNRWSQHRGGSGYEQLSASARASTDLLVTVPEQH